MPRKTARQEQLERLSKVRLGFWDGILDLSSGGHRIGVVGRSGTGKTSAIIALLILNRDNIYLAWGGSHNGKTVRELREVCPPSVVFDGRAVEDFAEHAYKMMMRISSGLADPMRTLPHIMCVFDDNFTQAHELDNDVVLNLFKKARQLKMSVVLGTQLPKEMLTKIRNNLSYLILTTENSGEILDIYYDWCFKAYFGRGGKELFHIMFNAFTADYHCAVILQGSESRGVGLENNVLRWKPPYHGEELKKKAKDRAYSLRVGHRDFWLLDYLHRRRDVSGGVAVDPVLQAIRDAYGGGGTAPQGPRDGLADETHGPPTFNLQDVFKAQGMIEPGTGGASASASGGAAGGTGGRRQLLSTICTAAAPAPPGAAGRAQGEKTSSSRILVASPRPPRPSVTGTLSQSLSQIMHDA